MFFLHIFTLYIYRGVLHTKVWRWGMAFICRAIFATISKVHRILEYRIQTLRFKIPAGSFSVRKGKILSSLCQPPHISHGHPVATAFKHIVRTERLYVEFGIYGYRRIYGLILGWSLETVGYALWAFCSHGN